MVSWEIRTGPRASLRLGRIPVQPGRRHGEISPRAFADVICNPGTSLWSDMPGPAADPLITLLTAIARHVHIDGLPHQADTVTVDEQLKTT